MEQPRLTVPSSVCMSPDKTERRCVMRHRPAELPRDWHPSGMDVRTWQRQARSQCMRGQHATGATCSAMQLTRNFTVAPSLQRPEAVYEHLSAQREDRRPAKSCGDPPGGGGGGDDT